MATLANNRQSLNHKIQMTSKRGPLKVAILTNVPSLAKMASMANIRQPLNYMPTKIAKGPLGKWRIWRNSPKMRLNFLWYVQRVPFNSGDFDQNDKHGDETKMANSSFSPNLPFSSKSLLFKWPLWTSLNFRQTFGEFSQNLPFLPFSSLVTFQGAPLDILEFSPNFWGTFARFAIFVVACIFGHTKS